MNACVDVILIKTNVIFRDEECFLLLICDCMPRSHRCTPVGMVRKTGRVLCVF